MRKKRPHWKYICLLIDNKILQWWWKGCKKIQTQPLMSMKPLRFLRWAPVCKSGDKSWKITALMQYLWLDIADAWASFGWQLRYRSFSKQRTIPFVMINDMHKILARKYYPKKWCNECKFSKEDGKKKGRFVVRSSNGRVNDKKAERTGRTDDNQVEASARD